MMLSPAICKITGKTIVRPLDGAFVKPDEPSLKNFQWDRWLNGDFQTEFDNSIKEHIGFHDLLVRFNNSIDYNLFGKINAEGVIQGKEKQLFEYDYIRAMEAKDYLGEDILERQIQRMKFLQQELRNYGTELYMVFEPNKARVYSELLPEKKYKIYHDKATNYSKSLELCEKYEVDYIDLNKFFMQEKEKHQYPLFPQYGVHWSIYGMNLALDTLVSYLKQNGNTYIPDYEINRIVETKNPQYTDFDLGYLMNLLSNPECEVMGYPRASVVHDTTQTKPKILAVGDSFYLNILNYEDASQLFIDQHFWYYNNSVYSEKHGRESVVSDLNIKEELMDADIVLMGVTERFLYKNLWGFVDDAYAEFGDTSIDEPFIKALNIILSDNGWFSKLIEDAKKKNIPLWELLEYNADFLVYKNDKEAYMKYHGSVAIEKIIRADEKWFLLVKSKALRDGISIDEAVTKDAEYVFKNSYPGLYKEWLARQKNSN